MIRHIKRSVKYLIMLLGVIILLPTVLYLLLQTPAVQTFMVKRITNHFSLQLKSTISIGSVEYRFFNKLLIKDLLIKDQHNDTLIYSKSISAGIRNIDFKNKYFRLGKVSFNKPVIALITDSAGMMNLNWYLDLIKGQADTAKKAPVKISVDEIDLSDARFSLINMSASKGKTKIDFNNIKISGLNGIVEDFKILNDTTSFSIYNLGFRESSGFTVRKLNSSVTIASQKIHLTSALIICDSSILNITKFAIAPDSATAFRNFTEKVKLELQLEKSLISTAELKYFIPFADSLNESVWLSGKIMGTIAELRGRNIKLAYRNYTTLDCDFDFSGLPKIESTFLYIGVNSLRTNAKDIVRIKKEGKESLVLPDVLKNLGNVSFNGSFTGFTTDFVTYGEIRTSQGNISTDISLRPDEAGKYKVKGLLTGSNINLGELTSNPELLGHLSMHANIDGYAYSFQKFAGSLTGKADSLEFNKYTYRNIALNGSFTEKAWDGSVNISDKNIKLNLLGLLNFKNKLPEFDLTLNIANAKLYNLNFDKIDTSSMVTVLLTSNFKGNSIDNLDGEIKLLNSKFRKFNNNLELYDFSIKTYKENTVPVLSLRSDFVDADIHGYYNFGTVGSLVNSTLETLMPSQFRFNNIKNEFRKNKFTFAVNFKNTDKINNFFKTGLLISDKSFIKGEVYADSLINITGRSDSLNFRNNVFKDFSFNADVSGSELTLNLNSPSLSLLGQSELKDFTVGLKTKPDNFIFTINWDNKDRVLNQGTILARGTVTKNFDRDRYSVLKIDIDSSQIYSENNLWKLSNSSILVDSSSIKINKLYISNNERSYQIDGTVSENTSDTLHLEFKGIDIDPLNYLINRKKSNDPTALLLDFKGQLNGKISLTNVYKSLLLSGNIAINNFSVFGSEFGKIAINASLDNVKKIVNIRASNNLNSVKMFDASGYYDPASKRIDLTADASKLPITFLNPLLKSFASEINGTASGRLRLAGETSGLTLTGAARVDNATMKITYLQTKYSMSDTVRFDKNGIKFNDIKLTDVRGNTATLSGAVYHKSFHDYVADIFVKINSGSFQVLNTLPKDNPLFYGTAYATGSAKIKSDQNSLSIEVVATTGKNSKMAIPMSKGLSVSEYSYITFEDSTVNKKLKKEDILIPAKQLAMDFKMNLVVTPDAEIQIIFDSKVGDVMKGHGSSPFLNVSLNKKGEFAITGDYTIEDGDYTFTLGNIINKTFSVENGGKIMFNGDLKNAEIELKANYLNLRTSLSPVLGQDYTERIRVEPQMNLSGKLFNPIVGFDIYLPDADEQTRTYLRNSISTEEELTRQVFSLLLMNSFISTGALSTGISNSAASTTSLSTSANGTSAMAATTFEMVSSQISNWLSQISKDIDIGINIRPGYNAISPQEAQLALSTQLLNNKLVLNGNFDVRGAGYTTAPTNTGNSNQLTGDFDLEMKLTEKFRLKVFNRFNDTYLSGFSPYTQGVGIFYKQDFNKFSDLFRKKVKPDMKKEEEVKIKK